MSGVYWCCCEEQVPQICTCNHVCPYAWIFTEGFGAPSTTDYIGSLFSDDLLLVGQNPDQAFTVLFWTERCNDHGNQGYIWNTYEEDQPWPNQPTTTDWFSIWADINPTLCAGFPGDFALVVSMRLTNELGDWAPFDIQLCFENDALPTFNMIAFSYRRVVVNNKTVPQVRLVSRYVTTGPQTAERTLTFDPIGRDGDFWGLEVDQAATQTYIGAHVGPCDPYFDPTFDPYDGCIDNLTIYEGYLSDTELDEKWNDGRGIIDDASNIWDQWCPTPNFCLRNQVGANGTVLQSRCPIEDEQGRKIRDGAGGDDGLCIYGIVD